ncbi:PRD domain-containing protein [Niallia circulans]|uniref:PRD domain-containing protein n=1 Tax=Niallia circulans TaxID=1397 RepID=A0A553SRF2_NIACI|nr:PRD domain-containing protein [Niallia circulans]TRZ39573.1 PRD domain-containing protein [Niallia circulans]
MKVSQILNNNIAIVKRGGNDIIIYSKGIAFKKKVGQTITESEIEKTYVLDSNDILEHFSYLLSKSDANVITLVNKLISYGEVKLGQKANDYLNLTLLDHFDFALKRAEKGQFVRSPLTWEVRRFYPKHFEIGLYGLSLMHEMFNINFPEDEAVSIALHFVNLQEMKNGLDDALEVMETIRDIVSIIKYHFQTEIDEKSLNYMRLVTHLQYFIERIVSKRKYNDNDLILNTQIRKMYKEAYGCVQKIKVFIRERYKTEITIDEETYLILHINRVTNRNEGKGIIE